MSKILYLLLFLAISFSLSNKDHTDQTKNSYLSPEENQYQQIVKANTKPAKVESYYDSDEFDTTGVDINTINANAIIKRNIPSPIQGEVNKQGDFPQKMNNLGMERPMGFDGMEEMSNMGGSIGGMNNMGGSMGGMSNMGESMGGQMGGNMGGMGDNIGNGQQSNNYQNYNNNNSNKMFIN